MSAAKRNNLGEVKKLLLNGADPNLIHKMGWTALHYTALKETNIEITKLLISYGADCNALNVKQWTPLHNAARYGHEKTCQCLLHHGADPNLKTKDGKTPLALAENSEDIKDESMRQKIIALLTPPSPNA